MTGRERGKLSSYLGGAPVVHNTLSNISFLGIGKAVVVKEESSKDCVGGKEKGDNTERGLILGRYTWALPKGKGKNIRKGK